MSKIEPKIAVWVYNLTDFTVVKEEVDYIKDVKGGGKMAVIKRRACECGSMPERLKPCKCNTNTKSFIKFEMTEREALVKVHDYIGKEIDARNKRMEPLKEAQSLLFNLIVKIYETSQPI